MQSSVKQKQDVLADDKINENMAEMALKDEGDDHPDIPSLMDLNDYCLLEILTHFNYTELRSIRLINYRFKSLAMRAKRIFEYFEMNPKKLKKFPLATSMPLYKALGKMSKRVTFSSIDEASVNAILPLFAEIDFLVLRELKLKEVNAIHTFPNVRKLDMYMKATGKSYMKALLQKLAPGLEHLNIIGTYGLDLISLEMPRLKYLALDGLWLNERWQFWNRITNLEEIYVQNYGDPVLNDFEAVMGNWKDIARIQSLWKFYCTDISPLNMWPESFPQFLYVTDLRLEFKDDKLMLPILEKFGPQLKSLELTLKEALYLYCHFEVVEESVKVIELIGRKFSMLNTLFISTKCIFKEKHLLPLYALKRLNIVILALRPKSTFDFARSLPSLEHFINRAIDFPKELVFPPDLIELKKKENRSLQICRSKKDSSSLLECIFNCFSLYFRIRLQGHLRSSTGFKAISRCSVGHYHSN